jgi:serine/threonine-protein kinase HipA
MSITKLRVMFCGYGQRWHLGTLAQAQHQILFEYSNQAREMGLPISPFRAPLNATAAIAGSRTFYQLPAFIADSLPDGWGMLLMDRAFRTAGRDFATISVLDRLAVVGAHGMGALAYEPEQPLEATSLGNVSLLQLAKDTQQILQDDDGQTGADQLHRLLLLGGSPQGARPKATLRWDERRDRYQAMVVGGAQRVGEPWLIKFPAQYEHAEVCAVEEAYARLARSGGIDIPSSRHIALGSKHAAFAVRRFDRSTASTDEQRIHIISASGLLEADHRLPSLDYESLMLATAKLTGDYRETLKVFDRCIFNVLTHNRDDHAKNFAWIMDAAGKWKVSPAFDLTYSFGPAYEHSTSIAGSGKLPTRADLLRAARNGGVRAKDAERRIDHWLETLQPRAHIFDGLNVRSKTIQEMRQRTTPVWQAIYKK